MKFRDRWKIKTAAFICCIVFVVALGFILSKKATSPMWVDFYEHEKYKNFFNGEIKEIVLQKSFNTKVIFSDEDLIAKWEKFFRTLKIHKENRISASDKNMNGGGISIGVVTENLTYYFSLKTPFGENDLKFEIDDFYYGFTSDEANPFYDTYAIAKERYGEINLWE